MQSDLHEVQTHILRELLFHNGATFSSLNKLDLSNDHFTFHIKQLIREGLLEKKGKLYFLTQTGKQFAGKLDVYGMKMEKFGSPSIAITAIKMIDGKKHLLIHQRLKEPLYGYFGFANGKVKFGELVYETAARELLEETGLTGEVELLAVQHRLRGPSREDVKLDHFFFIFICKDPQGELKDTEEGKNFWKTEEEIKELNTFAGFEESLKVATTPNQPFFAERFIKVDEI